MLILIQCGECDIKKEKKMYFEDNFIIFMMGNVCYKKETEIEDEGTKDFIGTKLEIHIKEHKK